MSTGAPERILLIQLHHLGDVVLTTPAARAARRAFPNARIDFATGKLGAQALEANPHLNNILVDPPLSRLYRSKYDFVADMHSVPRTALMTAATRAHMRVGIRGRGPRNLAYTLLLDREKNAVYMARQKLRLLSPLGIDPDAEDARLEITLDDHLISDARATLDAHGLKDRVAAISPVARHAFKQWGAKRWAAVADALVDLGMQVVITSGPGEEEQARAVADLMEHEAVWQYDRTSVRQLAALYHHCKVWAGNDGGPKHIAVAAGTPTVTVIRRQLGAVWSDSTDPKQVALNSGGESLSSVQVEDVVSACNKYL